MDEKRRYHRLALQVPLQFRVPPSKNRIMASTRNISGTGILFRTDENVKVRQELLMYFQLPGYAGESEIHGKVVRVESGQVAVRVMDPIKFDERRYAKFYASNLLSASTVNG
jgi:hypothetical protein